jgi:uncharacterized protein YggE
MDGRRKVGVGVAALVLGLALGLSLPITAQQPDETSDRRTVTVSGTATIRSAPDEAVVSLGVRTEAETAKGAMQQNAERMTAVIGAIVDSGISREDIATAYLSLYPNYSENGTTVSGYVAENQIAVTVRDIPAVGDLIDLAVDAGADTLGGITFQLSDENEGRDDALRAAVEDARSKAEVLADATGATLGQVVSVSEASSGFPPPVYEERAAADLATPIVPPELETQVTVSVEWALA